MKRHLLPLFLVILLLCPACGRQPAEEPENTKPPISEAMKQARAQSRLLYAAFGYDEDGNPLYPEEFSGTYYGEDELLHILIVNGTEPGCYDHIVDANYVQYETARNSLNALCALKASLWEAVETLGFRGISINQKANVVVLDIPDAECIDPLAAALDQRGIDREMYTIEVAITEYPILE